MKSRLCIRKPALVAGLCAGLVGALSLVSAAAAQQADGDEDEKDVVELGRHVVTGSRIRRIDVEEARPVVVITREDIELSGRESVADVLRNNPVNSVGSSRERSGNAWIGQATINLHGIGANRTLVLLTLHENALLAYGSSGIFEYELEARHTRYDGREDSCCFPKAFTTLEYVSRGLYNPFDPLHPGNSGALAAMSANSTRDSRADFRSYSGNVGFDLLRAPGPRTAAPRRSSGATVITRFPAMSTMWAH